MSYQILNGNELLIQGGLEAGFHLYTGYPGSPLADFFNILYERKEEFKSYGARVVIANSEANAAAMASGAKMAGHNVLVAMKSMGLHVAADALSVGNFANTKLAGRDEYAGVVIAVGDDPWSISTSTPADSRYLFKHLHIPFLEPSNPQELKDWMKVALELSQKSSVYVGVLLTTFMAEGGGRVEVSEVQQLSHDLIELDPSQFNLQSNVMVPPNSLVADREMIEVRFPKFQKLLAEYQLDKIYGEIESPIGIIASGAVFETLKQVLEENKILSSVRLYKSAGGYLLNEGQLLPFLKDLEHFIVVEEKRNFLETEIHHFLSAKNIKLKTYGKSFFPAFGGLNFEIISEGLKKIFSEINQSLCPTFKTQPLSLGDLVPKRLPTFCPGCPHRETLSVMKEVRGILNTEGIKLISHGDVGCYSLSFLEPFKEMHDLSAMGQGGALGAGTDIFIKNPSVVLMGDSTFFHSGMSTISNSVQMGHNITYILLDNDNTAMTGHQMTPVSGISVEGDIRPRQNIRDVVNSLKVEDAIEVNPSDRYFYLNLLLDYVKKPGTKVIISNKECGLTFHGRLKKQERDVFQSGKKLEEKHFYQINTAACEDCRACVEMTGCPGLSQTEDAYGPKVMIDLQICVADSYCTQIKACPSFELVKVYDYHPTFYKEKSVSSINTTVHLPIAKKDLNAVSEGNDFRCLVIGVGGSGVTTISRVIAEAAEKMEGREDLNFKFVDQKGLAQRNGSVSSHLSLFSKKKSHGQVVPMGTADLILSPDLIEGARALSYLSEKGLLILDEDYQMPLSLLLERGIEHELMDKEKLQALLVDKINDRMILAPVKRVCSEKLGRAVYASSMLLGIAFQAGSLPFSYDALQQAIKQSVPKSEQELNLKAFELGREWFVHPERFESEVDHSSHERELELLRISVGEIAYPWQNKLRFESLFMHYKNQLIQHFPSIPETHLARYVHDIMVYDQHQSVSDFFENSLLLKDKYQGEDLVVSLRTLAKTYWIKDEIFVSFLMSSPLKLNEDLKKYSNLGSSFDVVHINRPSFEFLGKKVEFDFSPKKWMLKIMRHLRFLRIIMTEWHSKEKKINQTIRREILTGASSLRLRELDNVKGYRLIRYQMAERFQV